MNFDGKVVVVTGGARGIGRAITQRFHAAGAQVAILGRNAEAVEILARHESVMIRCSGSSGFRS